jgi:hypothetical protein
VGLLALVKGHVMWLGGGGGEGGVSEGFLTVLGGVERREEHGGSARGVVVPLPWCTCSRSKTIVTE